MISPALQRARDRLAAGDVQSARTACETAVRDAADPRALAQAKLLLATCWQRLGDRGVALRHAREAIAADAQDARVLYGAAEIEEAAGQKDVAIDLLQRAIALDP